MTGHATSIAAAGALTAAATAGPLTEVFNELGLVLALMGGFGGVTRGLAIRLEWRETARGVVLGALFGFGFGVMSPHIIERLFDVAIEPGTPAIPAMAAAAFIMGFMQDVVVSWLSKGGKRGS
jgi:hypothetical protein